MITFLTVTCNMQTDTTWTNPIKSWQLWSAATCLKQPVLLCPLWVVADRKIDCLKVILSKSTGLILNLMKKVVQFIPISMATTGQSLFSLCTNSGTLKNHLVKKCWPNLKIFLIWTSTKIIEVIEIRWITSSLGFIEGKSC